MNPNNFQSSSGHFSYPNQPMPSAGMFQQGQNSGQWDYQGSHMPAPRFSSPQFMPRPPWGGGAPQQFNNHYNNLPPRHRFQSHNYPPNNNYQHHNQGRKQKPRVDKRELPENNKFFCDTCDRGFATDEKFTEHVNGHERCSDPSCSYVAAPKLVKLHFQMQHRSGFAKKIWQVESPEDIKKWIEERKRNFPTATNIERKKSIHADRRARGEKLETKYFGKMRGGQNNRGRGRQGNRKRHSQYEADSQTAKKPSLETDHQTSKPSNGDDPLQAILQQESANRNQGSDHVTPGAVAGGLASIMSSYTGDTDSDEAPDTTPAKNDESVDKGHKKQTPPTSNHSKPNPNKHQKRKKEISQTFYNSKQPTLLEQLLAKEIRHERNVLLQCVHFIVKKNFFDLPTNGRKSSAGS